jgi:hypothetical protein
MFLPHSLIRRRLRFVLLFALSFAAAIWLLSGGQQKEVPKFDAKQLEHQHHLVWRHIHSFDGIGGGKQIWLCGVRIWQHYITRIEFKAKTIVTFDESLLLTSTPQHGSFLRAGSQTSNSRHGTLSKLRNWRPRLPSPYVSGSLPFPTFLC